MTTVDSSASTHVCPKCSEEKPLTLEFFSKRKRETGYVWNKHICRECNRNTYRETAKLAMQKKRATPEGLLKLRQSVAEFKKRAKEKDINAWRLVRQGEHIRKAERESRVYIPREDRRKDSAIKRLLNSGGFNAIKILKEFLANSSDEEVKCWYAATGKPWLNPRLTAAEKWSVRYKDDLEFNVIEKARLYAKKMRRKHGIAIANDKTVSPTLLIDARTCLYCGAKFDDKCKPTLDHLIPLTKGGTHSAANLVVCCLSCNSRKGARDFLEFVQTLRDPFKSRSLRVWRKLRGVPPQQCALFL